MLAYDSRTKQDKKHRAAISAVGLVSVVIVAVLLEEDLQVNSVYCAQMVSLSGCVEQGYLFLWQRSR
jgi:hypothetical protein